MSDTPSGNVRQAHPHRKKHRHRVSKPLTVTPPLGQGSIRLSRRRCVGLRRFLRRVPRRRSREVAPRRRHLRRARHSGRSGRERNDQPRRLAQGRRLAALGTGCGSEPVLLRASSGYAPAVFHSRHVRVGDVLGFMGNTGDAFGGAPHLHFEVHPHQLLRLRYDGAVDPTTYLNSWPHLRSVRAPFPVHPRLPRHPTLRREARQVFRQLLVARHLVEQPTTPIEQREADRPELRSAPSTPQLLALREEPAMPKASAESVMPTIPLLAGLLAIAVFLATPVVATMLLGRLWRNKAGHGPPPASTPVSHPLDSHSGARFSRSPSELLAHAE